ncbi:MAG: DUF4097 domain-containing protein [bacterium]|nr:DUF4097 domain-containing protein [bacterium]
MKKRDIILVIVVICFGLFYSAVKDGGDVNLSFFRGCSIDSRSLQDRKHPVPFPRDAVSYKEAETKNIDRLEINNPAGNIDIGLSKDGTVRFEPVVTVYHRDKKLAEDINKDITVNVDKSGDRILVTVDGENKFPYRRVRVTLKCLIPKTLELELKNRYGNLVINDAGKNITIDQKHGELFVKNVDSGLSARHRHGLARLYNIKGKLELKAAHARVKIKNVPSLSLKSEHSRVWLNDIMGDVDITRASHCVIMVNNTGKFVVDGRHTRLQLEKTKDVDIKNSHTSIYLTDVDGDVSITGRHCRIEMEKIVANSIYIKNTYDYVDIEELSCTNLDMELHHGDLNLRLNNTAEKIDIKGKYTDVTMAYPSDVKPSFNISTYNGKIVNNSNMDFAVDKGKRQYSVTTQEGKPQITIDTRYGAVILKNAKVENKKSPQKTAESTTAADAADEKKLPAEAPVKPTAEKAKKSTKVENSKKLPAEKPEEK